MTEGPGLKKLSTLTKYGPIATVLILLTGILAYVNVTDRPADIASQPTPADAEVELPEGVLPFEAAEDQGIVDDIDWGERCDIETGKLKLPLIPQQSCFAPFEGDNGGDTAVGVTADKIKVVIYIPQDDDAVLSYVYGQVGVDDTPQDSADTTQKFVDMFDIYYEQYGRSVDLVVYQATGHIADSTAATADAESIARDIKPFVVINGPLQTSAFAETLAANQIMCIACTPSQPDDFYEENSPYMWSVLKTATQNQIMMSEYIGKRLAGRNAVWAGDESMHDQERKFGYLRVIGSDNSQRLEDELVAALAEYGTGFETIQVYASPTDMGAVGKDIITAFKEAGVTSVVLNTDPLAPQGLTQIATEQEYFPEWIVTGSVLVDTTIFSRTYDQEQWAHAFGISNLFARVLPSVAGPSYLYTWYYGETAAADQTIALLTGALQVLYGALQGAGPNLTHESFKTALFASEGRPSTPTSAHISFGSGLWASPDFAAVDDQTEIWWDAEATGGDETGTMGTGMWRYVDGGNRILPGEWPDTAPDVFNPETSIDIYDEVPDGTGFPDYEPIY